MVWSDVLRVVLAVVFGAAIGLERELRGKAAGLRTNVLICIGAAIFTLISRQMTAGSADSLTRIAAGVVTGVGFLGAGAIIQDRGGVHGMTTAATIWVVASIGMACGAGIYLLAAVGTFIAIITLIGLGELEKPLSRYRKKYKSKELPDDQD
ncbi:MAG: MgtC/SapB family protein [Planctomycetes bacterium]|nr:MgtC/SapB family protein [Planctomycetota bacterium]